VPARVRSGRGARLSFSLDEAATVAVELQRALAGRREGRACRRPSRRNRRGRRCTRHVRVARLTATDAAGNRSAPQTASFSVRR
jgi:hypothetical protein